MAKLKKNSKRMSCRLKYKIIKKVKESKRKQRRTASNKKPKDKDIGVPNSAPFKHLILRQAQHFKEAQRLKGKMVTASEMVVDDEMPMVVDDAKTRDAVQNSKNSKLKDVKRVIEEADVILQVLDARDPLGTRSPEIEDLVIRSGKKLVLLLNKIDLIPKDNLEQWLKYLRLSLPTVAFKASTQKQFNNLSQIKTAAIHMNENLQSSSCCIGASFLMKIIGNYCRNHNIQTFIKVGVVGFPNVGKSSVINSLARCRSCPTGATPGLTKSLKEVSLDKKIKIIDSPGVIISKDGSPLTLALQNAVKVESIKDVITPAEAIIQKVDATQLCMHYTVPEFATSSELLYMLAKRMGQFKKGGVPNLEQAARRIINDWTRGKIKYFTLPPESYIPEVHITTKIVSEMSKGFDISALEESAELDKVPGLLTSRCVAAKPTEIMAPDLVRKEEKMDLV